MQPADAGPADDVARSVIVAAMTFDTNSDSDVITRFRGIEIRQPEPQVYEWRCQRCHANGTVRGATVRRAYELGMDHTKACLGGAW